LPKEKTAAQATNINTTTADAVTAINTNNTVTISHHIQFSFNSHFPNVAQT